MRFRLTFVVIVLTALATGGPSAQSKELDNRTITCREFLASGQANMAALISWLRGYHAGKTGPRSLSEGEVAATSNEAGIRTRCVTRANSAS
jgi:hypothetical protein